MIFSLFKTMIQVLFLMSEQFFLLLLPSPHASGEKTTGDYAH